MESTGYRESRPLHYLSIAEARSGFASGAFTPVDVLEACLQRVGDHDKKLHCWVHLTAASAREEAKASAARWAAGRPLSQLDGVPVGIKDLFDTEGVPTAAGCRALRGRVPTEDAHAVALLRSAGAVLVGKLFTTEFASGGILNPHYRDEVTRNPFDLGRSPGTSSAGTAAALAAGHILAGTGSDTGGSIRGPAAFCGLTGMKPTYGLVSKRGVFPLSRTLDTAGPLCRSAQDCALFLNVIKGHDPADPDSLMGPNREEDLTANLGSGLTGLNLGVVPSLLEKSSEEVKAHFKTALKVFEDLGCCIVDVEPLAGTEDENLDEWELLSAIMLPEKATYIEQLLRHRQSDVSPLCLETAAPYLDSSVSRYIKALGQRERVEAAFEGSLRSRNISAYILPTTKTAASSLPADLSEMAEQRRRKQSRTSSSSLPVLRNDQYNTMIFNITRQPSIAFPMGLDSDGLPTSCMVSGPKWADAVVLRIAHAFQTVTDHHLRRPSLSQC